MIQKPLRRRVPNDLIDVQKRSAIFLNTPREKLVFPNVLISPTLPCPLTSWTILESLLKYKSNFGHRVFSAVCEPNKQLDQFGWDSNSIIHRNGGGQQWLHLRNVEVWDGEERRKTIVSNRPRIPQEVWRVKKTAPRFVSICLKLNEVEICPQRSRKSVFAETHLKDLKSLRL